MEDPSLTLLNPAFSESLLPRELCPQPSVVRDLVVYSHVQVTSLHRPQSPYTLTLVHILLVHQGGMSHQNPSWSLQFIRLMNTQEGFGNLTVQTQGAFSWQLILGTPDLAPEQKRLPVAWGSYI